MAVNMMMQSYVYGHVRWPLMSELYEYVQGVFLIKALASVALSPGKPTFNVTSKGVSLDHDHVSELAWPFVAIFLLLVLAGCTAAWRYINEPGVSGTMLVVGIWSCFNLLVAGVALGVVAERRQAERNPRLTIARTGLLTLGDEEIGVQIRHVSASACGVAPLGPVNLPANADEGVTGWLRVVPAHGQAPHAPVRVRCTQRSNAGYEFEFEDLQPQQYRTIAELMYGDTEAISRFIQRRRKPIGLLRGSLQFAIWGLSEPFRALVLAFRKKPVPEAAENPAATAVGVRGAPAGAQPVVACAGINEASWLAAIVQLSGVSVRQGFTGANADGAPFMQGAE
jgi:cellulose synthase (UDP-forming)